MSEKSILKPKAIDNISYWMYMEQKSKVYYSLGNKEVDRYIKVPEKKLKPIMETIELFDGNNEIHYIQTYLKENKKINIDVYNLYKLLSKVGLIEGEEGDKVNGEMAIIGVELLSISFPKVNNAVKKSAEGFLFLWKLVFIFSIIMLISGIIFRNYRVSYIIEHAFIVKNSHILGLVWTMLFCFIASLLHELMHWCFAIKNGLRPDKFKMVLYSGIIPTMYVKINGLYTLEKKKRITVMMAGILMNLLISFLGIILVFWFNLKNNINDIILKLVLSNLYMVVTNIMPFTITDGYYIFCWTFGIVNIRINILKALKGIQNGEKIKMNRVMAIYGTVSIMLLFTAMYSSFWWFYNIINEVFNIFNIPVPEYIPLIICLSIIGVTLTNIILKFRRFFNS